MNRRVPAATAALAVSLALEAGCSRRSTEPAARGVTIGLEAPVRSLDPATAEAITWSVVGNVFEGLVGIGPDLTVEPVLATRWSNPDDLTWIFDVRAGVRFHDGAPLDAAAIRAGLERVRANRESPARLWLSAVESIEVQSDGRLRVRTRRPDPLLLLHLAQIPIAKGATSAEVIRRPIGTGAYRVGARSGDRIELVAWDGWWGPKVKVPRVTVLVAGDGEAAIKALDERRVDVAAVPLRAIMSAPNPVWTWSAAEGFSTLYLWIGSRAAAGPLADVRVRRAISLAIDRRAVARAATGHDGSAATQLVPKALFGFDPKVGPPPYDPAAARRLLAEAGYPRGLDTEIAYRSAAITRPAVEVIVAQLAVVGIRAARRELSFEEARIPYRDGARALLVDSWTYDVADAASFLRDCVRTRDEAAAVGLLNPGFSDAEMDRLVDQSVATLDASKRFELLARALALARDRVPAVPLFHIPRIWGVARDVDWNARIDGRLFGTEMSFRPPPTPRPARSPGPLQRGA